MQPDLESYWRKAKTLEIEQDWPQNTKQDGLRLVFPLGIGGVTIQGLRFTVSAYKFTPFRWVTFQIEVDSKAHPKGKPMVRFEWRPKSPHSNKGLGPPDLQHVLQKDSHLHCFEMNWAQSEANVRRGHLPIAVPVEQDMHDYQAALDFVEEKFNIEGVSDVPAPPWAEKQWL